MERCAIYSGLYKPAKGATRMNLLDWLFGSKIEAPPPELVSLSHQRLVDIHQDMRPFPHFNAFFYERTVISSRMDTGATAAQPGLDTAPPQMLLDLQECPEEHLYQNEQLVLPCCWPFDEVQAIGKPLS